MRVYSSLVNIQPNIMAAVDVETTGRMAGYHEIIQIAVQPLDSNIELNETVQPFYMLVAPNYPERAEKEANSIHGLNLQELCDTAISQERAIDMFYEWFDALGLPHKKSIVPLAHNWSFEAGFLKAWLGLDGFDQCFHPHPRDSMQLGIAINDRCAFRAEGTLFKSVGLPAMCRQLGVPVIKSHDALADAIAEAKLYRALMQMQLI
jgi:DNA polymerase III epsilon subunit-like protein